MTRSNSILFGSLNIPCTKEIHDSAQFTSLPIVEVSKLFQVRMYLADYTGKTVEYPTQTNSLELVGWNITCG